MKKVSEIGVQKEELWSTMTSMASLRLSKSGEESSPAKSEKRTWGKAEVPQKYQYKKVQKDRERIVSTNGPASKSASRCTGASLD